MSRRKWVEILVSIAMGIHQPFSEVLSMPIGYVLVLLDVLEEAGKRLSNRRIP